MDDFCQRYAEPVAPAQELVRSAQRVQALIQRRNELHVRIGGFLRLCDDGTDRCQHVLDTVVELGAKRALVLLRSFALRDVDVHANQPAWPFIVTVANQTTRIDPANLGAASNDTVFYVELPPPLLKSLLLQEVHSLNVVWVQTREPLTARYFSRSLGKAVDGGVALIDPHSCRLDVIGVVANERGLTGQRPLHVAPLERLLGPLALRNVPSDAEQSRRLALGIAHNRAIEGNPTHFAGMGVVGRRYHPVFGLPNAAAPLRLGKRGIYPHQVLAPDAAPRLF